FPPRRTLLPYTTLFRSLPDRLQARRRLGRRELPAAVAESLAVEALRREQSDHRVAQAVVHRRVGAVAAQEAKCRGVLLPQLADRSEEHTSELQSRGHLV